MTILQVRPALRKRPVVDFNAFDQLLRTMAQVNLPASNGDVGQVLSRPAVNVKETGEAFFIEVAAPGLDKQDFEVRLDKNVLHIAAKKEVQAVEGETVRKREFGYAQFERRFELPDAIDANGIQANYFNGILALTLPKKETAKEQPPRVIDIA